MVAPPLYSPRKLRERWPALGSLCGGGERAPLPDNWGGNYKYHLSLSESDWLRLVLIIPPGRGEGEDEAARQEGASCQRPRRFGGGATKVLVGNRYQQP